MLTIGICGASGSGKSTLARRLSEAVDRPSILLSQDSYYLNHPDIPFEERERINFDAPDAFDHDLLLSDLEALREGRSISRKGYDFTLRCRCDSNEPIEPAEVVILEGIHCFYDPRLREKLDLKLFIDVDPDICVLRRVRRDLVKRGRLIDGICAQYLESVKPMFEQYIRGYSAHADFIVAGGGKNWRIVDLLSTYIAAGKVLKQP